MMTPGPWSFVYFQGDKGGTFLITANNGEDIAACNMPNNARAIAALPELVEAAEGAILTLERAGYEPFRNGVTDQSGQGDEGEYWYGMTLDKLRAALAKMGVPK